MLSAFLFDYIAWVYVSALAVIQIAAARSDLAGLLYARTRPRATTVAGGVAVLVAVALYFTTEERNQPDTGLGLDANVQAFWFAITGSLAVATTLALTSAINHRWGRDHGWRIDAGGPPPAGVAWLSRTTFFHAMRARIAYRRRSPGDQVEA